MTHIDNFDVEKSCIYKDEEYLVRDNGAIYRLPKINSKPRKLDKTWTFGKINSQTGYLEIATRRVHRIVATAFHGPAPSPEHVVDHIDTNRQNNRIHNLRWVTRLENILLNPITYKKIKLICGDVEEFLKNPQEFKHLFKDLNFQWMTTVSKEEGLRTLDRLQRWALTYEISNGERIDKWIINPKNQDIMESNHYQNIEQTSYSKSLSINALQEDWQTPTEFPCCPAQINDNPLLQYFENLCNEKIFSKNQYNTSVSEEYSLTEGNTAIVVLSRDKEMRTLKPYFVAQIRYENGVFVHQALGSFFKEDGAKKQFTIALGKEWTGGDTFDDLT